MVIRTWKSVLSMTIHCVCSKIFTARFSILGLMVRIVFRSRKIQFTWTKSCASKITPLCYNQGAALATAETGEKHEKSEQLKRFSEKPAPKLFRSMVLEVVWLKAFVEIFGISFEIFSLYVWFVLLGLCLVLQRMFACVPGSMARDMVSSFLVHLSHKAGAPWRRN